MTLGIKFGEFFYSRAFNCILWPFAPGEFLVHSPVLISQKKPVLLDAHRSNRTGCFTKTPPVTVWLQHFVKCFIVCFFAHDG